MIELLSNISGTPGSVSEPESSAPSRSSGFSGAGPGVADCAGFEAAGSGGGLAGDGGGAGNAKHVVLGAGAGAGFENEEHGGGI